MKTTQPQYVEINDATDCDIYLGDIPTIPREGQARTCKQCHHATWLRTPACMWCGFDKLATPSRLGAVAAITLTIAALWLR